jgi:hypothetical protein
MSTCSNGLFNIWSACGLPGSPDMRRFLSTVSPLRFGDVLTPVKLLREGNSDTSLLVFARYFDLEQRLGLFEARADDW